MKTPFRPDPAIIQNAKQLRFEPPLDEGIRDAVLTLIAAGVETFQSCQGGRGHSMPEPTVQFEGSSGEGLRALAVALDHGLPVKALRRTWRIQDRGIYGPWWEMTFWPPACSELWTDRDTTMQYDKSPSATTNCPIGS